MRRVSPLVPAGTTNMMRATKTAGVASAVPGGSRSAHPVTKPGDLNKFPGGQCFSVSPNGHHKLDKGHEDRASVVSGGRNPPYKASIPSYILLHGFYSDHRFSFVQTFTMITRQYKIHCA